jgi:deoxyadenosine/deoxycytidine kinase
MSSSQISRISLLGNIGAGKTELTLQVHRKLPNFALILEGDLTANPFLADFITKPTTVAFQHQTHFLVTALQTISHRETLPTSSIQDFSILACPIFAEAMYIHGFMSEREFHLYSQLCTSLVPTMPSPTLCIYVKASVDTLVKRVKQRGRTLELALPRNYLQVLQELYDERIGSWLARRHTPFVLIDTDQLDLFNPTTVNQFDHPLCGLLIISDYRRRRLSYRYQ